MSGNCQCGKPAPDAFLCKACSLRLERALGDLPALIADLDITLTRQAVVGASSNDGGKPTAKDAQPLSLNLAAADVAHDLRHTLVSAIKHLTEARGITDLPKDDPVSMANWLRIRVDSIRLDPAGPDIAEAVHAVKERIWAVIDHPTTRGQFKVGNCIEVYDDDGGPCPGEVWAYLPAEDLGVISTLRCRRCAVEYEPRVWQDVGDKILKRGAA